jgi:hypothetical protein
MKIQWKIFITGVFVLMGMLSTKIRASDDPVSSVGQSVHREDVSVSESKLDLDPEILDASFIYEARQSQDKLSFTVKDPVQEASGSADLKRISAISSASFGIGSGSPGLSPVKSFAESLRLLEKYQGKLKTDEKILLLALAGEKLAKGYDLTSPEGATSLEQLFENARIGGNAGGVCRDIHSYLAEYARALGFKNPGVFSFAVGGDRRHQVSYFQDASSGQFLVQDYFRILGTGKSNLQEAIDVATSLEGVMTEVVYLNGRKNVHAYTPSPARWISRHMKDAARLEKKALISMSVAPSEKTIQISVVNGEKDDLRTKGFFVHSDYESAEGVYRLDLFGAAAGFEARSFLENSWLDEIGFKAHGLVGHALFKNPAFIPELSGNDGSSVQQSEVMNFSVKGHARIDRVTGTLLLEGSTIERSGGLFMAPFSHQIRPGLTFESWIPGFVLEFARSLQLLPDSMVDPGYGLKTAYDQVSVVYDTRGTQKQAYLYFRGDYYAFDGISDLSASGVRAALRAAVPSRNWGEFALVLETSRILKNRFQDPFFDTLPSAEVSLEWLRRLSLNLDVGSTLKLNNGRRPASYFESPNQAIPDPGHRVPEWNGSVWLRFKL